MNRAEFSKACTLAKSDLDLPYDNLGGFNGFGQKGFRTVTTIKDMAALIRWQALMLNGNFDGEMLNEVWLNKGKFVVVG